MGNIKVVNAASEEGQRSLKEKENNQKKLDKKKKFVTMANMACIASNFFIKQAQIVFMIYIIFFDTNIVEFSLRHMNEKITSVLPYIERIWIYAVVAVVFFLSVRNIRRYMKMLTVFVRNRKSQNIKIPTNMKFYVKDAILELVAGVLTLMLISIINYWDGMTLAEYILSWYYVITILYYVLAHTIEGIVLINRNNYSKTYKSNW